MPGLLLGDCEWSHPLIAKPARNVSRRHLFGLSGGAIAAMTVAPAIHPGAAQSPTPDAATPPISGDQDAVSLLTMAVEAMTGLETFHFLLETTSGESKILDVLEIESIEGDVRRPYDFQTTVNASLLMGTIEVTAVGIDGQVSIEDPTSAEGAWIDLGSDASTLSLLNPDYLFLQAVSVVQNAEFAGEEDFEGVPTRKVIGTVSFSDAAGDLIDEQMPLPTELSSEPVDLTVWIDERSFVLGVEIVGPVLAAESFDIIRLITFSAFNEPVDIVAPEI